MNDGFQPSTFPTGDRNKLNHSFSLKIYTNVHTLIICSIYCLIQKIMALSLHWNYSIILSYVFQLIFNYIVWYATLFFLLTLWFPYLALWFSFSHPLLFIWRPSFLLPRSLWKDEYIHGERELRGWHPLSLLGLIFLPRGCRRKLKMVRGVTYPDREPSTVTSFLCLKTNFKVSIFSDSSLDLGRGCIAHLFKDRRQNRKSYY